MRIRTALFVLAALMAAGFIVSLIKGWQVFLLTCLFGVWLVLSAAVPMPRLPGLLRVLCKSFPNLTARADAWMRWLEFDLTADEARQ